MKKNLSQQPQPDIPKKNHKLLKTFLYFLITILLLTTSVLGFWFYQEKVAFERPPINPFDYSPLPGDPHYKPTPKPAIPSDWQTYQNEEFGLEFRYPADTLTVSEEEGKIMLTHSIPYEHQDPCDWRDNVPPLKELTDFKVTFKLFGKNLKESVIGEGKDYLAEYFLSDDKLKVEQDFIDEVRIDSLKGYRITTGVEGCGQYEYYFPLTAKKTLVVNRSFITEFNPIILDYEKYLNLPGIIAPQEEEKLFTQILSSFKF